MVDKDCFGGFGFGAWAGRGGRRFRWRVFERGDLKFVILRLVGDKPMHGYEVMQALEEESGGWYKPSPGSVYPTLQMLEDEGLLESLEEDGGKKTYRITEEGRRYLEKHGDVVEEILDRVSSFAERFWGKESRELSSSFSRLAQVVFESAFAWEADPELLEKVARILDRAREEVEGERKGRKARAAGTEHEEGRETDADQQG